MTNLTATEKLILNNMSREHDPGVFLGDKIFNLISDQAERGTPVNAKYAYASFVLSAGGVHGGEVTVNNPTKPGQDVYEFLADAAQKKSAPTNIAVDIHTYATASTGTLTMDTQPTPGDTVTIGEKTYIFVPVGTDTADGEVSIGADLAGAQSALVAAINGTDEFNTSHPLVRAGAFAANASAITALIAGTVGDTIITTETFTAASNIFAAATLGSGADCSIDNTIKALNKANAWYDTQGIMLGAGTEENSIIMTSKIGGAEGNGIVVEGIGVLTNNSPSSVITEHGVNGTVSSGVKILVDNNYIYVCIRENAVDGQNWYRIALPVEDF